MSDDQKHEIVIIRRGGHGDHDEHHGGVWKIAFADFMTAMMAFFLVMWLISANDKTRASVARYFNPVRLVDATTQPRGLHDPKKDESGITATADSKLADDKAGKPDTTSKEVGDPHDGKTAKPEKESPVAREHRLDEALRQNPLTALAEIAASNGSGGEKPLPKPATQAVGRLGGEAFRDPFAPPPPLPPGSPAAAIANGIEEPSPEASPKMAQKAESPKGPAAEAAEKVKKDDAKQLFATLEQANRDGPHLEVRRTNEGLLVSFTDTSTFSMFANGSAVPARKLVLLMERVAALLKNRAGGVIIRGFTDNKPYRSGRYDNWHLSLDRAQVTHYMLVRGGFDDVRIEHVEGYADRATKPGVDPSSPLNRRVEILLKEPS